MESSWWSPTVQPLRTGHAGEQDGRLLSDHTEKAHYRSSYDEWSLS